MNCESNIVSGETKCTAFSDKSKSVIFGHKPDSVPFRYVTFCRESNMLPLNVKQIYCLQVQHQLYIKYLKIR